MNQIARHTIAENVFFNSIKDDRFKTVRISATMFVPLRKETAAANALLPKLLARSCKAYPDATSLNKKLNSLYGAGVGGYCRKMGEALAITIGLSGIDDRYTLLGETLSAEFTDLLCQMLFAPKVQNGAFDEEDFLQEKRQLIDSIDSEYNEKRIYASNRLTQIMCKDEAFGINRYGSKEQVAALTPQDVYQAWEQMLATARIELMMLGSGDSMFAVKQLEEQFKGINRAPQTITTEIIKTVDSVKEETEEMDVSQCKLFMGFRAGMAEPKDDTMAMRLAVTVLGGTSNSKLFLNVREKYSLCYYCAARYDRQKGIMVVDSGVESENIEKAKEEILHQLSLLQQGEVSDFELESAKRSISNGFNTMTDTLSGTEAWYISQMLDRNIFSPQQATQQANKVTKADVIDAAKKITLDTVYVLKSQPAQ